ncbi:MAG: NHL repeat-containing protein [Spirochaetota bacterium]
MRKIIILFILFTLALFTACGSSDSSSGTTLTPAGNSTTASRVYGQSGNFLTNNTGADGLNMPCTITVTAGGVYIADTYNHRVLYYEGENTTASRVYGQGGSFTTNIENKGGVSADSLNQPSAVAVDTGGVYIADSENNRVLYYAGTSTTATRVYGQGGSFSTNSVNNGGISADSLNYPYGVAVDAGGVYIADRYNHRVMYYTGTSTTATRVYGQGGSFSANSVNNGGVSADSLSGPSAVTVDASGVYVADYNNHRVMYYAGTGTTATRVYGQGGSFTANTQNNGGVSADSLYRPSSVAVDAGGVYAADFYNNRVLYYAGTGTTATRVYGQGGSFTANYQNNGGLSENSLYRPSGVAVSTGGVYIVDHFNYRALYYAGTSTTATRVYGQEGSYNTRIENYVEINADSLYQPTGAAINDSGIYIADRYNHRVIYYAGTSTTASRVYGQGGSFNTGSPNKGGVSADSLNYSSAVAADADGVYIADRENHRVLYYAGTSTTATRVYGQGGSFNTRLPNKGGISADSLNMPYAVAIGPDGIYIADAYNHRVLYYEGESTTATRVYGQGGSFVANIENNGGVSAHSLNYPYGVAVQSGNVYIADSSNYRVLYYEGESTTATRVYGQGGSFSTNTLNKGGLSADCLYYTYGVAVDTGGVYIADTYNHRVLYYEGESTTATRVYGQGGSFITDTINNGGISADSLYFPYKVSVYAGRLYIADTSNNRVLYY